MSVITSTPMKTTYLAVNGDTIAVYKMIGGYGKPSWDVINLTTGTLYFSYDNAADAFDSAEYYANDSE